MSTSAYVTTETLPDGSQRAVVLSKEGPFTECLFMTEKLPRADEGLTAVFLSRFFDLPLEGHRVNEMTKPEQLELAL